MTTPNTEYYQDDDPDGNVPIESPDETLAGADWIKKGWDLPPYGSADFYSAIGGHDKLDAFKKTPAYQHAVDRGLIHDDEWVADHVQRTKE